MIFGEYSILLGSRALSIPYPRFSGRLVFPAVQGPSGKEAQSNQELKKFLDFLLVRADAFSGVIDLGAFGDEVNHGLFFDSDIPVGYGVGSSGALCAAVFGRYGFHNHTSVEGSAKAMAETKRQLGAMESFFHGTSSGFDPLVIYHNSPLTISSNGEVSLATLARRRGSSGLVFFLLDTRQPSKTHSLVTEFLERFVPDGVISAEGRVLGALVDGCVDGLMNGDESLLQESVAKLSALQLAGFHQMIPDPFVPHWREGLDTGLFSLKLCGSGGGGYLLGVTHQWSETCQYFAKRHHHIERVEIPFG